MTNDRFAEAHGWQVEEYSSDLFNHRLYASNADHGICLNVYIDGDGRPWRHRTQISLRPETSRPLMLRMMAIDNQAALYVTRPCYNERVDLRHCQPWFWTHGRYSPEVVASMTAVVKQWIEKHGVLEVNLYGHSGGGTLAMLMANGIPQVRSVITVAGNLDTDAWARFHDYSYMEGSLNPTTVRLRSSIRQFHYMGEDDRNIPPNLFPIQKQPPLINVKILSLVSHLQGWRPYWAKILDETMLTASKGEQLQ